MDRDEEDDAEDDGEETAGAALEEVAEEDEGAVKDGLYNAAYFDSDDEEAAASTGTRNQGRGAVASVLTPSDFGRGAGRTAQIVAMCQVRTTCSMTRAATPATRPGSARTCSVRLVTGAHRTVAGGCPRALTVEQRLGEWQRRGGPSTAGGVESVEHRSDAVLSCPCCLTPLCYDCQR